MKLAPELLTVVDVDVVEHVLVHHVSLRGGNRANAVNVTLTALALALSTLKSEQRHQCGLSVLLLRTRDSFLPSLRFSSSQFT